MYRMFAMTLNQAGRRGYKELSAPSTIPIPTADQAVCLCLRAWRKRPILPHIALARVPLQRSYGRLQDQQALQQAVRIAYQIGRITHSGLKVNVGATAVNRMTLGEDLLLGAVHYGSARGDRALLTAERKERGHPVGVHQFLAIMVASVGSPLLRQYAVVLQALSGVLLLVGSLT
jgi:hypothetical protein